MAYESLIEPVLHFLADSQTPEGEFRSQCYLPGAPDPQWYYSGPSPFLTSNIAWVLQGIDHPLAEKMLHKSLDFLLSLQERFGLWRYWEHNSPIMEYNVPCDIDDTCLVSYLLENNGRGAPDNRDLIRRSIRPDGNIDTWFLPQRPQFGPILCLAVFPRRALEDAGHLPANSKIPNREPISSIHDAEAAVEAHAMLYLGRTPKTERTLKKILREAESGTFSLQYYDRPHFVYYHLSRLSLSEFPELQAIRAPLEAYVEAITHSNSYGGEDHLQWAMCALALGNFGWWDFPWTVRLMENLGRDPMVKHGWRAYKYWTSKQRSWWAGSPELTAALYLEGWELMRKRWAGEI